MPNRIEALQRLIAALEDFLESGWESEGSGNMNDPHAGMDPRMIWLVNPWSLAEETFTTPSVRSSHSMMANCRPRCPQPLARIAACLPARNRPLQAADRAHRLAGELQDWAKHEWSPAPLGGDVEGKPELCSWGTASAKTSSKIVIRIVMGGASEWRVPT